MAAKKTDSASANFEASMTRLQSIVRNLEAGEVSLDAALDQFEEGMGLAKICDDQLNAANARVEKIIKDFSGQEKRELLNESEINENEGDNGF